MISLVKYLNTAPLHWGLTHGPFGKGFETRFSTPAECSDQLASGEASIGLIPAVEYQNIHGLRVLPGISIASFGPVRSVVLISKKPAETIRSLALDQSSRTSSILVKLLLEKVYDNRPVCVPMAPDLKVMLAAHDAALLIGDAALRAHQKNLFVYDLASEWARWTGFPFVFALWALRPSAEVTSVIPQVYESKNYGLARRREIAEEEAEVRGLTPIGVYDYLSRCIDYDLEAAHLSGLHLFYQLAREHGLLSQIRPLEFVHLG